MTYTAFSSMKALSAGKDLSAPYANTLLSPALTSNRVGKELSKNNDGLDSLGVSAAKIGRSFSSQFIFAITTLVAFA